MGTRLDALKEGDPDILDQDRWWRTPHQAGGQWIKIKDMELSHRLSLLAVFERSPERFAEPRAAKLLRSALTVPDDASDGVQDAADSWVGEADRLTNDPLKWIRGTVFYRALALSVVQNLNGGLLSRVDEAIRSMGRLHPEVAYGVNRVREAVAKLEAPLPPGDYTVTADNEVVPGFRTEDLLREARSAAALRFESITRRLNEAVARIRGHVLDRDFEAAASERDTATDQALRWLDLTAGFQTKEQLGLVARQLVDLREIEFPRPLA